MKNSRIPALALLKSERQELIANGTPESRANGVLAKKYIVTPGAIRARLKKEKSQ